MLGLELAELLPVSVASDLSTCYQEVEGTVDCDDRWGREDLVLLAMGESVGAHDDEFGKIKISGIENNFFCLKIVVRVCSW